ncbi:MAG: hypothetical protein ACAH80_09250 [Alphaproteobacteria bacterium]
MAAQVTPDAEKGRVAMQKIAVLLFGVGFGALAVAGGALWGLVGLGMLAMGKGAAVLGWAGTFLACSGGVTAASYGGIGLVGLRNKPHLDELVKQRAQSKLEEERKVIADREAAEQEKEQEKQRRAVVIEYNAQAAVKLKKDVKTMRPLKFGPKTPQQQQAQP